MADYYWYGTTNAWGTAGNWLNTASTPYGVPPTSADNVFFGVYGAYGRSVACLISVDATCNNLYMDSTYVIAGGIAMATTGTQTLTVSGTFTNNSSTGFVVNKSTTGVSTLIVNGATTLSHASNVNCRFGIRDIAIFNGTVSLGPGSTYGSIYTIFAGDVTFNQDVTIGTNGLLGLTTQTTVVPAIIPKWTIVSGKTIFNNGVVYLVSSNQVADYYTGAMYGPGALQGNSIAFRYAHATVAAESGHRLELKIGGALIMNTPLTLPEHCENSPGTAGDPTLSLPVVNLVADGNTFADISLATGTRFNMTNRGTGNYSCSASGNFTNAGSGTLVEGLGTFTFNGATGTQVLTSGGDNFHHLIHSGAGTLQLADNCWIDGQWLNSAGSFDANGKTLSNNMAIMF